MSNIFFAFNFNIEVLSEWGRGMGGIYFQFLVFQRGNRKRHFLKQFSVVVCVCRDVNMYTAFIIIGVCVCEY